MINPDFLKEFIEKGTVSFRQNSISYIFTCPRCTKQRKLYIRKKDGKFRCFRCGETENFHGNAEYALSELYGIDAKTISETINYSKDSQFSGFLELNIKDPYSADDFGLEEVVILKEVTMPTDYVDFTSPKFEKGLHYLNKRGIELEHIKEYGIKYHPSWNTVVFPVITDGKLVGWQERSTVNDFRYTLKGFQKEKALMFQDRLDSSPHAVLCEGPVDSLKAHICGGNVCAMGKGVSDIQLGIIKNKVNKLYLALDPDAAEMINKICKSMYDYMDIYILFPPEGKKDLGECTFKEVYEQFLKAPKYEGQVFLNFKGV